MTVSPTMESEFAQWLLDKLAEAPMKYERLAYDLYFDNAHDIMYDVWQYPRVTGDDRHGHATPKPVAMIERAIKSSCAPGGIVIEPFGGSGSTLIAADNTYTLQEVPDVR